MQSIAAHIYDLNTYTTGVTAAENRYKTSRYIEEDKAKTRAHDLDILNQLAAANRDAIDSEQATQERTAARQKVTDQLTQEPERVRLAWDAMQPLLDADVSLRELALQAATTSDLAAVQVYGTARLRADAIRAQGHAVGSPRNPQPSEAEKVLDRAVLDRASALGIDTRAVVEADIQAAMRSTWGALAAGIDVPTDALTTIAVADSDLYQAVRNASIAKMGHPLGMDQVVAVAMAQRQAAAPKASVADADGASSAA